MAPVSKVEERTVAGDPESMTDDEAARALEWVLRLFDFYRDYGTWDESVSEGEKASSRAGARGDINQLLPIARALVKRAGVSSRLAVQGVSEPLDVLDNPFLPTFTNEPEDVLNRALGVFKTGVRPPPELERQSVAAVPSVTPEDGKSWRERVEQHPLFYAVFVFASGVGTGWLLHAWFGPVVDGARRALAAQ